MQILIIFALLLVSVPAMAANPALKKNQVAKVGTTTCGFLKKWVPVKKIKGSTYQVDRRANPIKKSLCSGLLKPGSTKSLTALPSPGSLLKSNSTENSMRIVLSAVSGTPPTLGEIIETGPTSVFWRPGIIGGLLSGSPSPAQCQEFAQSSDGESGGFSACYMSQGVGSAVSDMVQAGTTLCYMKNFPTRANVAAGAVSVSSGSLPTGGIEQLFSVPSGARSRTVKVVIPGEGQNSNMFLKIYSAIELERSGDQYKFDFWACDNGPTAPPQEIESVRITSGGEYVSRSSNTKDSDKESTRNTRETRAFLRREAGGLAYDTTRTRVATSTRAGSENGTPVTQKAVVSINSLNEVVNKVYGSRNGEIEKRYTIARFSGSGIRSVRFLEGAYKDEISSRASYSGGVEYRGDSYVTAANGTYTSALASVDFGTDEFYGPAAVSAEPVSVSCRATPDIVVELDMENSAMQAVQGLCEGERLNGVNFCQSAELNQASTQYFQSCVPQG